MTKTFLKATRIGSYAQESLDETNTGKIIGGTSKGVFFLFGKKSVFLTRSQALSPFNISIEEGESIPDDLLAGDEVFYSLGDLLVPARQVTIALASAEIWSPPPAKKVKNASSERQAKIQAIIQQIQSLEVNKGFLFISRDPKQLSSAEIAINGHAKDFASGYSAMDLKLCLTSAEKLFGLGTGLTPSGDDLITGYLLFQSRLSLLNGKERAFNDELGRRLTDLAYQKTTWVSANRLEAACRGWSEAMFLETINFVCGNANGEVNILAKTLFGFGHSSGVDTFIGIALAAKAL